MGTVRRLLAVLAIVLVAAACNPPAMNGGGWSWDPSPSHPITIQAGASFGWPMQQAADRWNVAAGTTIFAIDTTGNPDVTFAPQTPICPLGDCSQARQMWVEYEPFRVGGYITHCVIHYDPTWAWLNQYWWNVDIVAHELGHCLDYPDVDGSGGYRGNRSLINFYDANWRAKYWWGPDDQEMLARDGYGP